MRTGLRTEIILSISLLLAAALLFAGFLLLKLTERTLLDQQRVHAADTIRLVVASVASKTASDLSGLPLDHMVAGLNEVQALLSQQNDIMAWRLLDRRMQALSSMVYQPTQPFAEVSPSVLTREGPHEELVYRSFRLFQGETANDYLDLSAPLHSNGQPFGLLQIRFSLDALHQRVSAAQKLLLVYVVVYGTVLAVFGVYLLNRNVVKPVRQLHQATTTVAAGDLASVIVPTGPGEIHDLADSFNQMIRALALSRTETEAHIATLEETNRALAQARDDLVRSEKLATVGHLAAGMAHEIGNPLGAVVGYLNILKEDLSGEARDLAERSLAEAARIDRLVRELLDYAAPVDREPELFCPVSLLREVIEMLRHQGQFDDIEVDDNCVVDACLVEMDRDRLMQVWINLLLNARDAMDGHGKVDLTSCREGGLLVVTLTDYGPGIDPSVVPRVFEPFFTTKDPGRGYGLGLAVCQRIVAESGGMIAVSNADGKGARFAVSLPCTQQGLAAT